MDWSDDAIVLSHRPLGESALLVAVLAREHGRWAGLVHGQRLRARLQPGTLVRARWRARLADQLGTLTLEAGHCAAAGLLDRPLRLGALAAAIAVAEAALPERLAFPLLYDGLSALLDALPQDHWDAAYVAWEAGLLGALGFGLDLARCAATGETADLAFVSPRTGRAISRAAAGPWRERLLPLPAFLIGRGPAGGEEILAGLALTGHFIERSLFGQSQRPPPPARARFVDAYRRSLAAAADR